MRWEPILSETGDSPAYTATIFMLFFLTIVADAVGIAGGAL